MYINRIIGELLHKSDSFEGDSSEYKSIVGLANYSNSSFVVNGEYYPYCVGVYTYSKNYVEEWVDESPSLFLTYEEAYSHFKQLCLFNATTEEEE